MTIKNPEAAQTGALRRLWQQAFGDPDAFLDGFFFHGFSFDRCRCISADDGTPVAVLYWFDCLWKGKKLAYLYAIATEEAYQGQGLCRALMENTHSHLQGLGYSGTVLVPGSRDLFRLYEKLGYIPFCPMAQQAAAAGKEPAALRQITADEYAAVRRKYLPADSVWQEGETLAYLQTFAQFYAGQDFAFCTSREEDALCFQEFLGNAAQLPGILAALGAAKGTLLLPGGSSPFAMYRSLDGCPSVPEYFGIALN